MEKSCSFMGEGFAHESEVCIPERSPEKCIVCKDGEWQDRSIEQIRPHDSDHLRLTYY